MNINLRVEPTMLARPDFQAVLLKACADLSLETTVKTLCLHEAGHLIYFEPIRAIMGPETPELTFVGPTITYSRLTDEFKFIPAAVTTPFQKCGLQYTDEILNHLARGAVAGGVFLSELQNDTNGGDDEDIKVFDTHFVMARQQGLTPKFSKDRIWSTAKDKVREDLQDDIFKKLVRLRANRIEADHFSLQSDA